MVTFNATTTVPICVLRERESRITLRIIMYKSIFKGCKLFSSLAQKHQHNIKSLIEEETLLQEKKFFLVFSFLCVSMND